MTYINRIPSDVWRIIAKKLSKRDLLSLQLANTRLMLKFERTGDIWWGKHLPDYQERWQEYYNNVPKSNRDKAVDKQLMEMDPNVKQLASNICSCDLWEADDILTVLRKASIKP